MNKLNANRVEEIFLECLFTDGEDYCGDMHEIVPQHPGRSIYSLNLEREDDE